MYKKSDVINHNRICLYEEDNIPYYNPEYNQMPGIECYLVKDSKLSVVIFPGGGYFTLSEINEGRRIAEEYNKYGISAFVVFYRVRPYDGKSILLDGQKGIAYARKILIDFGYDPNKVAVCGFSAGAHLAMLVCEQEGKIEDDDFFSLSTYPNACIMCYPVCTFENGVYPLMPKIFLKEEKDNPELQRKYSFPYALNKMPPTYLFCTTNDIHVEPEKNAIDMANQMKEMNKDVVLQVVNDGAHGIGLGEEYQEFSTWHKNTVDFLFDRLK